MMPMRHLVEILYQVTKEAHGAVCLVWSPEFPNQHSADASNYLKGNIPEPLAPKSLQKYSKIGPKSLSQGVKSKLSQIL